MQLCFVFISPSGTPRKKHLALTTAEDISRGARGTLATTLAQTKCVWFGIQMGGCSRLSCKMLLFFCFLFFFLLCLHLCGIYLPQIQRRSEAHQSHWKRQLDPHHGGQEVWEPFGRKFRHPLFFFFPPAALHKVALCQFILCRPLLLFCFVFPWKQELVEYYQSHSLKESFKLLDTTLRYPYKARERSLTRASTRSPGRTRSSTALSCVPASALVWRKYE